MSTFGPAFDEERDGARIRGQMLRIRDLMADGVWRTLAEIEEATRFPQASISAQLRHLAKNKFGSHVKEKRRRKGTRATWEYRLLLPKPKEQKQETLFDDRPSQLEINRRFA